MQSASAPADGGSDTAQLAAHFKDVVGLERRPRYAPPDRCDLLGLSHPRKHATPHQAPLATIPAVTDEQQKPLAEQLDELGAQLDWVREYL